MLTSFSYQSSWNDNLSNLEISLSKTIFRKNKTIIIWEENCPNWEKNCIKWLVELYSIIKSKRLNIIKVLWLDNEVPDNKLIRETIDHVNKETCDILFSRLKKDKIVSIVYDKTEATEDIEKTINRVLIKLTIISWEIDMDFMLELFNWINNKSWFIDLIDSIWTSKMIWLLIVCDIEKFINYINSQNINNFRIQLEQCHKDDIIKFAKKLWFLNEEYKYFTKKKLKKLLKKLFSTS